MKRACLIVSVTVALGIPLAAQTTPKNKYTQPTVIPLDSAVYARTESDDGQPKAFPLDSTVYGKTYSEWSAEFVQYAFSIPVASNPLMDNGDCSIGQSGPVWFLGGKVCQIGVPGCTETITRSCSIPAGTALFLPIWWVEDSALEEPTWGCGTLPPLISGTISEMRQCVQNISNYSLQGARLEVHVDGHPIGQLWNLRVQSPVFELT